MKVVGLFQAYNEESMIPYSLGSIYDELDEVLLVEGAVEGWYEETHSTDDTIDIVRAMDVDNKITIIQVDRHWKSLEEMKNAFLPYVQPGDLLVINDADEVYMEGDIGRVRKIMEARTDIYELIPIFRELYGDMRHIMRPSPGRVNLTNQRVMKYRAGCRWQNHPTLADAQGVDTSISSQYEDGRHVVPDFTIFHLSYMKSREHLVGKHAHYDQTFNGTPPPVARASAEEKVDAAGSDLLYYDGPIPVVLEGHPLYRKDIVGGSWPHWSTTLEYRKPEMIESPYNIKWTPPPKVSVVITAYNNSSVLATTLPHWALQTYHDYEVIVVDDGSEEGERATIRTLVEANGGRYYYNDSGAVYSIASARNIGIWEATGDRILFTDSDMMPDPDMLMEHMMEAGTRNITVGCRHGFDPEFPDQNPRNIQIYKYTDPKDDYTIDIEWDNGDSDMIWETTIDPRRDDVFPRIAEELCPDPWEHVHGCNFSVHRQRLIDINGFDEEYDGAWGAEDTDVAMRLIRSGLTVVPVPASMGFHIDHPSLEREGQRDLLNSLMGTDRVRERPKSWRCDT